MALDAANNLIEKLKAEIAGLKQELLRINPFAANSAHPIWNAKTQNFKGKFNATRT